MSRLTNQSTNQSMKSRLKKCPSLLREVISQKERLQEMRIALESPITARVNGMPRHRHVNTMEVKVENVMAYERVVEENVQALQAECAAIERAIQDIPDPTQREICRLRYLQGLSWLVISERMNYEFTQCHRLHNKALRWLDSRG